MAKILVIGGGVAGLSAGIYALKGGHEVVLCERHSVVGGNLTGWKRGRYYIDNCIHWLTGTNRKTDRYRMWEDLGALGTVDVFQGESLYTCEWQGKTLSLYRDLGLLSKEMAAISPSDLKETERFIGAVKSMQDYLGVGEMPANIIKKAAAMPKFVRYARMSTGELAQKFAHPLIGRFLSCFIGENFSALALLVVFATFCGDDGGIPQGGSMGMARRMADTFVGLGGDLRGSKRALKINLQGNKAVSATFEDGENLTFDYVVCATDAKTTFDKLLGVSMPSEIEKLYKKGKYMRFSSFHTAFSCETQDLPFRGDYIFPLPKREQSILGCKDLILREFSHEPTFAPKGKTVLQTITFCGEERARKYIELKKDAFAYRTKKEEIAETIEGVIVKKWPQFAGKISCLDVWTPATYKRYLGEEIGAYMSGILPRNTLPIQCPSRVKRLKNVFLATQWQQLPGGLPTAALMGKKAAESIIKAESHFKNPFLIQTFSPKRAKVAKK